MASGQSDQDSDAGGNSSRRLYVFNGGFLTNRRVRRILALAGWQVRLGWPGSEDWVGVWGKSPTAHRGEAVARKTGARLLRIEDTFLRSVHPGRAGEPPIGLSIDRSGVHFDASEPSDLEHFLATAPLDDAAVLGRARTAIERLQIADLSKYNAFDPNLPAPDPGYVLVLDQTRDDASVTASGATAARFREMLVFAQEEHPGAEVLIKMHPETRAGFRPGYFTEADAKGRVRLFDAAVSPWALMAGARAVYTVSSQLGFEAIFAGHRPRVFGQPFYAGWGLTEDDAAPPHRSRILTRAQLFAAAMIEYPTWYDPYRDRLCDLENAIDGLEARVAAYRSDRAGYVAMGMRSWKRRPIQRTFGAERPVIFQDHPTRAVEKAAGEDRALLVWAGKEPPELGPLAAKAEVQLYRVEDGFLRSRGLGADLVPPLSLVLDDLGIYYDPTRESRLERLIAEAVAGPPQVVERAERLIRQLHRARVSKYNLAAGPLPDLPTGQRILVPGQVEDDASIRLGCNGISRNIDLLKAVREANPDAILIYKPHPDVEAGLRNGAVARDEALEYANTVLERTDPVALIEAVDEVWTLTSLLGFEALLRGRDVTCLGTPFYAGWGLTRDLGEVPARRQARPSLAQLVYAVLIAYPRYFDPVTGMACPAEVVVERLATGQIPLPGPLNRLTAKLQGIFSGYSGLWR